MRALAGLPARLVLSGLALALVGPVPGAVAAPARTENGVRCTVVGTQGDDVLKGTRKRDVICGRGGNDRIDGRGGKDLVDGGPGNDVLVGGSGHDVLLGGPGDDVLRGSAGKDVLRAGAGRDEAAGDAGADRLFGDDGDDVASGDTGDDLVSGGAGDDELSGGAGNDRVDGGPGTNVCDEPAGSRDTQVRCAVDQAAPEVAGLLAAPAVVDVSASEQVVEVRLRVTDDTGVARVQVGGMATRVSGTARDGLWSTRVRVPRYVQPGTRSLTVHATDRVGRTLTVMRDSAYTVQNSNVDRAMPEVFSFGLSADAVDVRGASRAITATARITDDLAGPGNVFLCPARAFATGSPRFRQAGACMQMNRVAGVERDSTWRATYVVPQGAPSGTWNFSVQIDDAAGNRPNDFWRGPDEHAANPGPNEPRYHQLPGGAGAFTVHGSENDVTPPRLRVLRLSPAVVDTSAGAVEVTVDVSATDEVGVTGAGFFSHGYPGYPDRHSWTDLIRIAWVENFGLVAGSPQDGTWRASFTVPGGTPDGEYFMQVLVRDASNSVSWISPDSGGDPASDVLTPELAPGGVRFVVRNS